MGKTKVSLFRPLTVQKHPHVHGEDYVFLCYYSNILETPPRAWGRLLPAVVVIIWFRNTPTCMGKTFRAQETALSYGKHPHVHGEDEKRE